MTGAVAQAALPDAGDGFVWDEDRGTIVLRPSSAGVAAAFTTRVGGVCPEPWHSLNVGRSVAGDDALPPHWDDMVLTNRDIAGRTIGAGGLWATVHQVHGNGCVDASSDPRTEADAIWTGGTRTIAVLAADCVPVLLLGERGIAVAHAGWRGVVSGVVQSAARAVGAVSAWAGPAIGPCCFEVGPEVAAKFDGQSLADDSHVDLWAAVGRAARDAGVGDTWSARVCTSCHPALFFSHRRDAGRTGRQALVARIP